MANPAVSSVPERIASPVWFGILAVAGGVYFALPNVVAYLLTNQGFTPAQIQRVTAVAALPSTWGFLLAPIVDLGRRKRDWILASAIVSAACLWPAIAWTGSPLAVRAAFLLGGGAANMLGGAAFGAMMTEYPARARGRLGGWYQAGNNGGGALGGAVLIWLAARLTPNGMVLAACVAFLLPVMAIFAVAERRVEKPSGGWAARVSGMAVEFREFAKFPRTWVGLLFLLSPAGSPLTKSPL
jgi:MFS transporter, PAT family, beta-lactamase induction signal transducer AmpG